MRLEASLTIAMRFASLVLLVSLLVGAGRASAAPPAEHRAPPVEAAPTEPNAIWLSLGGQAAIQSYNSFLQVGVGYERWLRGSLWLDLGVTALVHVDTNVGFRGGVRWWFRRAPGVCPFVRVLLEAALLHDRAAGNAVALTPRGGGGITWFSSPGFGLGVEANAGLGVAFGNGAHLAAAIDIVVGMEFRF